jgi:SnoaL-like domain
VIDGWFGFRFELWNGTSSAAESLVSEDFVGHWPDQDVTGPAGLAAMVDETQAMFTELTFTLEVGPIVEGDLVPARWTGRRKTPDGGTSLFGNDILRVDDDCFVAYWVASSEGS